MTCLDAYRRDRAEKAAARGFTPVERASLLALTYAMPGWIVLFERDESQGMTWASVCSPAGAAMGIARYVIGYEGASLSMISGNGKALGRYPSAAAAAAEIRRRETAPPRPAKRVAAAARSISSS